MGVPDFLCVSGSAAESVNPFRPSVDTVGGAAFQDDALYPADPTTMLTALAENQGEKLIVALARTSPVAVIYVKLVAGVPTIFGVRALSDIVISGDLTPVDHAPGDTEVTCPATKLIQPFFGIAIPQQTGDFRAVAYVNAGANGIRVETRNSAGTLADCDYALLWY